MKSILQWDSPKAHKDNGSISIERDNSTEYEVNFKNPSPLRRSQDSDDGTIYRPRRRSNRLYESNYGSDGDNKQGREKKEHQERNTRNSQIQDVTAKDIKEMQRKRSPDIIGTLPTSTSSARGRITFPSQQRYEDNLGQIQKLQLKLTDLTSQKQIVSKST